MYGVRNTLDSIRARLIPRESGCLEWPKPTKFGYGRVSYQGRLQMVHRLLYEAKFGPIPQGLEPDHVCRNTACGNVDHLEIVTHRVNSLRSDNICARHARKTHCLFGHEFTEVNTYIAKSGGRVCRTCQRRRVREWKAKERARDDR